MFKKNIIMSLVLFAISLAYSSPQENSAFQKKLAPITSQEQPIKANTFTILSETLYVDPLEMDTKNVIDMEDVRDNYFTLTVLLFSFIAVLSLFWGLCLFFGLEKFKKRAPLFLDKQNAYVWKQLQKEKEEQLAKTLKNPRERLAIKSNAIVFLSVSTVLFSYLYYIYVQDKQVYERKFSNAIIVWDKNSFFKNQYWKLSDNKIILDQNGQQHGTWRTQNNQLYLKLTNKDAYKLNMLTSQKVKYPRVLNFSQIKNSDSWHAFDYKVPTQKLLATTHPKNKYEIGRIKIIYSNK